MLCDFQYELYVSEGQYDFQIHRTHTGYHSTLNWLKEGLYFRNDEEKYIES